MEERTGLKPLKWYRALHTKKGRREAGMFLVEGERAVRQVMASDPRAIQELLVTDEPSDDLRAHPIRVLDERQLRSISSMTTPQDLIAVVRIPADASSDRIPDSPGGRILLLEDVQDPGNVGTLIRTAAAFGYSGVIMTEACADPFSPKVVQATAGSVLSVWIRRVRLVFELVERFRDRGYRLVAMVLDGDIGVETLSKTDKLILALGSEASGLSGEVLERADARVRIPISDGAESLNVAACGAICMYLSVKNED